MSPMQWLERKRESESHILRQAHTAKGSARSNDICNFFFCCLDLSDEAYLGFVFQWYIVLYVNLEHRKTMRKEAIECRTQRENELFSTNVTEKRRHQNIIIIIIIIDETKQAYVTVLLPPSFCFYSFIYSNIYFSENQDTCALHIYAYCDAKYF